MQVPVITTAEYEVSQLVTQTRQQDIAKHTVPQLKAALKARDVAIQRGSKMELVRQLSKLALPTGTTELPNPTYTIKINRTVVNQAIPRLVLFSQLRMRAAATRSGHCHQRWCCRAGKVSGQHRFQGE